jgi:hypothetical protein
VDKPVLVINIRESLSARYPAGRWLYEGAQCLILDGDGYVVSDATGELSMQTLPEKDRKACWQTGTTRRLTRISAAKSA